VREAAVCSRLALALALGLNGCAAAREPMVAMLDGPPSRDANHQPPLQYWPETRTQPRPLRIHWLKVDLASPRLGLVALVAEDPDGPGPAEAKLEPPAALAARHKVVAAVNANAFAHTKGSTANGWVAEAPVDIVGWAVTGGRQVSPPQQGYWCFWLDPTGRARVGNVAEPQDAREAVAGFGPLLVGGEPAPNEGGPLHPRTALGLDRQARWLWLVVVDGRQPGVSEGLTLRELALLLKEAGGWDALNLDGGGSSILLLAPDGGELRTMNTPSDIGLLGRRPRPVPVMLGIRAR